MTYDRNGLELTTLTRWENSWLTAQAFSPHVPFLPLESLHDVTYGRPSEAREIIEGLRCHVRTPAEDSTVRTLCAFVQHFVLYARVPWDSAGLLRFTYEQEIMWDHKRPRTPAGRTPLIFPVAGLSPDRSIHVLIEVPAGIAVDTGLLVGRFAVSSARDSQSVKGDDQSRTKEVRLIDATESTTRVHLYGEGVVGDRGVAAIWVRPVKRRLARYVWVYCLLSYMVLSVSIWLSTTGSSRSSEANDSLVLTIVGLVSLFAASSEEHPFVSLIVRRFRVCAVPRGRFYSSGSSRAPVLRRGILPSSSQASG